MNKRRSPPADDELRRAQHPRAPLGLPALYAGGDFSLAGGQASVRIARWTCLESSGDADNDGDIDLMDYASLAACLTGPDAGTVDPGCNMFDFKVDGDVDLRDVGALFTTFTGP